MNGCSTMPGHIRGLQVLIRVISNSAIYVHCLTDRLKLALAKAATNSSQVKVIFCLLEN